MSFYPEKVNFMFSYSSITQAKLLPTKLETQNLFDSDYTDEGISPIDLFIKNTREINKIWINTAELSSEFASMILLSYVSAFESYMRAIIRGAVNIDRTCQKIVASHQVSFAAAIYHKNSILPEALLEEIAFSNADRVKSSLSTFLGIHVKQNEMVEFFKEFEKICQLRHCCTHRFGKLGAKNAINLGIDIHSAVLEKPLRLTKQDLENALDTITDLAKAINSLIFANLLERTVCRKKTSKADIESEIIDWKWNQNIDRKHFRPYYDLFSSKLDAQPTPKLGKIYDSFRGGNKVKTTLR
ncbi:hypothetical protein NB640_04970 [Oxalobacter vibrioformis]|uniref:RiboL-PSP-HEPN domain-containing protein n=1 Tax=Oxalobacter vibrioformis TaxID=933080 RepID=A0A9E9M0L4_9BURK|nr:hypothetical protein [Oxalobacter vibrioformis]WAW10989.1 hypothetical protein NB640_04970 [Oxalobacter vibrioformis]